MTKKNLFTVMVVTILMGLTLGLNAQTVDMNQQEKGKPVTDQELETLIKISRELQGIQMNSQGKIMKALKNNDLSMQRYKEITQAKRQGQDIEKTEEEEKSFSAIVQVAQREQKKLQQEIEAVLDKHSMSPKRFQQINQQLRTDKKLQNRFKKVQQKQMQQMNQQ